MVQGGAAAPLAPPSVRPCSWPLLWMRASTRQLLDTSRRNLAKEIKKDRYKKNNFIRECKGIYVQDQKLMKVIVIIQIILKLFYWYLISII